MTTPEQVGQLLRTSISEARASGFNIIRGSIRGPLNAKPSCCAVGSMVRDKPFGVPLYCEIAERLGISVGHVVSIAIGFDGSAPNLAAIDQEWYDLGCEIRNEVKAGTL